MIRIGRFEMFLEMVLRLLRLVLEAVLSSRNMLFTGVI
jgi:hypothetical protein